MGGISLSLQSDRQSGLVGSVRLHGRRPADRIATDRRLSCRAEADRRGAGDRGRRRLARPPARLLTAVRLWPKGDATTGRAIHEPGRRGAGRVTWETGAPVARGAGGPYASA